MKKILFGILFVFIVGCSGGHIYRTYYGDIDIDTMEITHVEIRDNLPCYLVHSKYLDSVEKAPGVWGYIYGPLRYYYCPAKDTYYHTFPDNQGNMILRGYDPHTNISYRPDDK